MTLDELDRLAAEKVMGWYLVFGGWFPEPDSRSKLIMSIHYWQPTRNIAQAWECLEKFKYVSIKSYGENWRVWVDDSENCFVEETAPLAITKACLKAKGVEVE